MRHDLEMDGVAADDAAERDGAVVRPAPRTRRVDGDRNGARNFQRARHADALDLGSGFLQRLHGAGEQRIGDVVVIARLNDEDARALAHDLAPLASPRPGHRLLLFAWSYQAGTARTSAAEGVNAAWTPGAAPHSAPSGRLRY